MKCISSSTFTMSLEEFLEKDTFKIAAAYQLLNWAKLVASIDKKEKYEDLQKEVEVLIKKYGVTDEEIFGADCDLDAELPEEEVLIERADKLVAREDWI